MSQIDDFLSGKPSNQPKAKSDIDSFLSDAPQKSRNPFAVANDTVIEFANAAAGGVKSLSDMVRPGNALSSFIDKNIIKDGESKQSDVAKASREKFSQELDSADSMGGELAAVGRRIVDAPLLSVAQAAGSFALPGAAVKGVGKGAQFLGAGAKGVETAGRAGGIAAGAAMSGGDAAGTAYELSRNAGATDEQAVSAARGASVIPALVGGVSGAFGAEKLLAGGKGFSGGLVSRALKTGASEAGQEALDEGVTQYEGQRAAMPFDSTIDPMKGVAGAAGMGAALGGITGAGMSALHGGDRDSQPGKPNAGNEWTTSQGFDAVAPKDSKPITSPDWGTQQGAGNPDSGGIDFTRDIDTRGMSLVDRVRAEQDKANSIDFTQTDLSPKWGTSAGAAGEVQRGNGIDMPTQARTFDTGNLSLSPSDVMGIDPGNGPLSRAAATAVNSAPTVTPVSPVVEQAAPIQQPATQPQATSDSEVMRALFQEQAATQDPARKAEIAAQINKILDKSIKKVDKQPLVSKLKEEQSNGTPATEQATQERSAVYGNDAPVSQPAPIAGSGIAGQAGKVSGEPKAVQAVQDKVAKQPKETASVIEADKAKQSRQKLTQEAAATTEPASSVAPDGRPDNWRGNAIKAGKVARSLGLDPKGKRLAQIVSEIDAKESNASTQTDGVRGVAGPSSNAGTDNTAPSVGRDVASVGSAGKPNDASTVKSDAGGTSSSGNAKPSVGEGSLKAENVKDAQKQPAGTEAKAGPGKEAKAVGSDGATAGVAGAGGSGDVQADGVKAKSQDPFTHAGLKISVRKVKEGGTVNERWVVQSPDNAEREAKGERQIGGDRILETRAEAIATADDMVRRDKEDKASKAKWDEAAKAETDAAEAKKAANRGKSIVERRIEATLDSLHRYPASAGLGTGTKREAMQMAVDQDRAIVERTVEDTAAKKRDKDAIESVRRNDYMLGLSNENIPIVKKGLEAQARLKANKYEKPSYRVYMGSKPDGSFFEISKTEYDYAKNLIAESETTTQTPQAPQQSAAAPQAKPKEAKQSDPKQGGDEVSLSVADKKITKAKDTEYLAAVERGDMEAAQKMVDQAARDAGYISATDYRMNHTAPDSDSGTNVAELREADLVPADYWTRPDWYQSGPDEMASWGKITRLFRSADALKEAGKNPDRAGVWMYRAVPKTVKENNFRNGDWITPSREYAQQEGAMIPEGYRIITQHVKAKELWWDANSINEFGFDDGKAYANKNTKNNRKLVDVVTRDDDGNVIPLSKRFNERKDDPRFSASGNAETTTTTYEPSTEAQQTAVKAFADRLSKNKDSYVVMDAVKPSGARKKEAETIAKMAKTMFGREVVFVKFNSKPLFNGAVSTTDPGKVFLNIESARPMMAVLGHELLHELRKSNPAAYKVLASKLKNVTKDDFIYEALLKKKYANQGLNWVPQDISEELYGDIVGDNFMDPKFWEAIAGDKPILAKQLYRAVMNWLDKIASMFKRMKVRQDGSIALTLAEQADGSRPFNTQKYLSDIEAARTAVAEAMAQFGKVKGGKDSLSVSDNPAQTETAAFKKWFGDSQVVDADGKPLVVYHGTTADIGEFRSGSDRGAGPQAGIYFTSNQDLAGAYGRDGAVYPVYLSIKNPLDLTAEFPADSLRGRIVRLVAPKLATALQKENNLRNGVTQSFVSASDRAKLVEAGYDGLNGANGVFIAFDPEQIKSAIGNNGNFDGTNPDIRFSIADKVDQIKQFDVKTKPKNTLAHYRGMAMQALGRRQIVDLYNQELPQLETYDDLVQRMDAEKNETGAEADSLAQAWGSLDGKTGKKGEETRLADLMHDATLAQIDPDKPQQPGTVTLQYKSLKAKFDALSPEAKALYREARDMYMDHYTKVQKAIKARVERSEMSSGQKRQIMTKMDEDFFKQVKGVYFPLARFGQYVIVVKDANGEVKNVTRAESINEAEESRKQLQAIYPASSGNVVGKVLKQAEFNAGRDAVGKGFMADLMNVLDEKGLNDELRDTVSQLYLSSLPDLSWAKHGMHRKGTPGFSQDARRAFAQNMFHGSRYLAKLNYADQLQDQLMEMQEHVSAYEGVDEYDSIQSQQVVDEMVKRHESMMNPNGSSVSTALTSFGFVFHMGMSPASAMVNLTQTALVAFPQMGAKWGFTNASKALIKASEETVRSKNNLGSVLKGDELAAYDRAVRDGTIDVTMAHDLAGISQGEDQKVVWKMRPVMRWASYMFHHAEKFNRQSTFIAAYRLAKAGDPKLNENQLYEAAKKATYDGHFDYAASNRPRLMQGNWQKVIFLFKAFGQNMVYTLARNAYLSTKSLDPKERSQARRTVASMLAMHAAAAGALGLPIVGQLLTIASFIGGSDDEPWDAETEIQNLLADAFGKDAAEVMAHGLSRLTPFDISGRVALDRLILPDVQEGIEGQRWAESLLTASAGAVAGIGVNVARGLQKINEGKYARGIEDMMPSALRGPMKAMRYAMDGAVDKSGVVISDTVNPVGVAGQALGLSPSQVRRDTERRSAIYGIDRALMERRAVLMRMFANASMENDTETVQEVRADIQRFNEKNPNRRITMPNLLQSIRNRRKRIAEAKDGVYLPSKRRDALDDVRF